MISSNPEATVNRKKLEFGSSISKGVEYRAGLTDAAKTLKYDKK